MKNRLIISSSIIVQLTIILLLGFKIYHDKTQILGEMSISPISKADIILTQTENLKFFYEPKPGIIEDMNDWVPYRGTNTINADTLNERYDYSTSKDEKTYRVITLGDSFTYGLYVNTSENWVERLEDLLNERLSCKNISKFEIINLGVQGYDIQYAVERFRIRGIKYDPDLVMWFMVNDDIYQLNELLHEKDKQYHQEMMESGEFQRLVDSGVYYPSWKKAETELRQQISDEEFMDIQMRFLTAFNSLYQGNLVLFMFPSMSDHLELFFMDYVSQRPNTYYFNSLSDIYSSEELFFANDNHPTSKGHAVIAEDLYKYLTENNIVPCN